VERSALIMASTIHGCSPTELIAVEQVERVGTYNPKLLAADAAEQEEQIGAASTSAAAYVTH